MPSNRPRPRRSANRRPASPAARTRAPGPSGARRPAASAPAAPTGARGLLERPSGPLLARLTRLPRWLVGVVPGAFLLGGLLVPAPWGTVLLAVVALFLGWLLALSWPRLERRSKVLRTGVVVLLAGATVAHGAGVF